MKKLLTLLAFVLVTITVKAVIYEDIAINGIYYYLDSSKGAATVLSNPNKYTGEINIPSKISYNGFTYNVTSIGNGAFMDCENLQSVIVPKSVIKIGSRAFRLCSNLTYISIPNSVAIIGGGAFERCRKLSSFSIPCNVTYINSNTFCECYNMESVTIPNSVMNIFDKAFECCESLKSVTIGKNVKSIEHSAFSYCPNITSVTVINPTPIKIEKNAFINRKNATLFVPKGSKSAYQAADYWKEFKEIIEKDMNNNANMGDMDEDGEITVSDVMSIINIILGSEASEQERLKGDFDGDGELSVMDVVELVNIILGNNNYNEVLEPYFKCPDNHHPHLIDLGLPSGTKWACCNVDADKPEERGGYYAWGETVEKDCNSYDEEHYQYAYKYYPFGIDDPYSWEWKYKYIGSCISGTEYDVAHVKWGGGWQMPTFEQIEELYYCEVEDYIINGVHGFRFIGYNGKWIFLPENGFCDNYDALFDGSITYWSGTDSQYEGYAMAIWFWADDLTRFADSQIKHYGLGVRPVWVP